VTARVLRQPVPDIPPAVLAPMLTPVLNDRGQRVDWALSPQALAAIPGGGAAAAATGAVRRWRSSWVRESHVGTVSTLTQLRSWAADRQLRTAAVDALCSRRPRLDPATAAGLAAGLARCAAAARAADIAADVSGGGDERDVIADTAIDSSADVERYAVGGAVGLGLVAAGAQNLGPCFVTRAGQAVPIRMRGCVGIWAVPGQLVLHRFEFPGASGRPSGSLAVRAWQQHPQGVVVDSGAGVVLLSDERGRELMSLHPGPTRVQVTRIPLTSVFAGPFSTLSELALLAGRTNAVLELRWPSTGWAVGWTPPTG
jgi:hypothetical protein